MALPSNSSMNRLAIRGLMGDPWPHHGPVHSSFPEKEVSVFETKLLQGGYFGDGHGSFVAEGGLGVASFVLDLWQGPLELM